MNYKLQSNSKEHQEFSSKNLGIIKKNHSDFDESLLNIEKSNSNQDKEQIFYNKQEELASYLFNILSDIIKNTLFNQKNQFITNLTWRMMRYLFRRISDS